MRCVVKGCNGRLRVKYSGRQQDRVVAGGGYVYLPPTTVVRTRQCDDCKKIFRSIEIPLDRYERDLTFMRSLKALLREYTEKVE